MTCGAADNCSNQGGAPASTVLSRATVKDGGKNKILWDVCEA